MGALDYRMLILMVPFALYVRPWTLMLLAVMLTVAFALHRNGFPLSRVIRGVHSSIRRSSRRLRRV